MSALAIKITGLTKVYKGELGEKDFLALDDLNCEVEKGEVFAFLGPNGAGKTTTIKLLTRLLFPTKGKVRILGKENNTPASMEHVGYLPEQPNLYGYLTGREMLTYIAKIFNLNRNTREKRITNLFDRVGLGKQADASIRSYSRGMVQRLALAQALINDPELLILDEPMASLDPVGRKDFRDLILKLKQQGKTIFFSSHILSDAEMIADRVCILNQGRQVSAGKLDDLLCSSLSSIEITFILQPKNHDKIDLDKNHLTIRNQTVMASVPSGYPVPELLKKIEKWGGELISVVPRQKSLEDVFMKEIGG